MEKHKFTTEVAACRTYAFYPIS